MIELKMPKLGQIIDEFIVVEWKKKVGDAVKKGDILLEVETDKAIMEVESYADGILEEIIYKKGTTIKTGEIFARLKEE